jgi:hypothetical protein
MGTDENFSRNRRLIVFYDDEESVKKPRTGDGLLKADCICGAYALVAFSRT